MKVKILAGLLIASWLLAIGLLVLHKDRVQLVKLPPASLAQWYKPQNKRQQWLHNMFKLRREMQAARYYAESGQAAALTLWTERLNQHYQKIREMVPEWGGRLDQDTMRKLLLVRDQNSFAGVSALLDELQGSCDRCHAQFRAVTAAMYRAPDFKNLRLKADESLADSMRALNRQVNFIKIAIGAGDQAWALNSLNELRVGIDEMGMLCENCHTRLSKRYPDRAIAKTLDELQAALEADDTRQQAETLGMLAVTACAQCHGTHRIAYDMRQLIRARPGVTDLLRH